MNDENIIVCRCSDITLKDLRELIAEGYTTFSQLKHIARVGMGPCQSKTCAQLVMKELARSQNVSISELKRPTIRPTNVGVKLKDIARQADNEDKS